MQAMADYVYRNRFAILAGWVALIWWLTSQWGPFA